MGSAEGGGEPAHLRVSFAEAVTVLEDDFALTRDDADPAEESRFVTLGHKRQRMRYEEGRS